MIIHSFTNSSTMIIYSSNTMITHSFTKLITIFVILCIVVHYKYHHSSHSFVHQKQEEEFINKESLHLISILPLHSKYSLLHIYRISSFCGENISPLFKFFDTINYKLFHNTLSARSLCDSVKFICIIYTLL